MNNTSTPCAPGWASILLYREYGRDGQQLGEDHVYTSPVICWRVSADTNADGDLREAIVTPIGMDGDLSGSYEQPTATLSPEGHWCIEGDESGTGGTAKAVEALTRLADTRHRYELARQAEATASEGERAQ